MADPTATQDPSQNPRYIRDAKTQQYYDTAGGFLDPVGLNPDAAPGYVEVPDAQSYLQGVYQKQATARFQPQQDLALQGIDQASQGLDQNTTDVNRQYDQLGQTLQDAAKAATGNIEAGIGRFGFLGSGSDAAGLGKVQSDLSKNTANAAQDKASQLAQIALQRAGLATKAADVKLQTSQSINDMVNQLLSGSTQAQKDAFAQKLQLQQIAGTIPVGQSVTIQGQTIQGTMQPKLSQIDLGNKVVSIDDKGNIVNSYAKGLAPSVGGSFATTGGTATDLAGDLSGVDKNNILAQPGGREQLITQLVNKYASSKTITPAEIASAVYSQIRGQGEPAFNGLSQSTMDWVNSLSGKSSTNSTKDAQVQTNIDVANQALAALKAASANLNTATSRTSSQYASQAAKNSAANFQGNNADITTLNLKGAAILTAIRALTNTGRVTESEMNALQLPTIYDTKSEAQTKINNLQALLDKARGSSGGSTPAPATPAPTSGKTSSGLSFTITP